MDAPASLPSFRALAKDLADAARVPFDENMEIDRFLGSMPNGFDVHAQASRMILRQDSKPNDTHTAIVRLATSIGPARIVTTNFDDHLAAAALAESAALDGTWIGPALPMGDAFEGVLHLHGSVLRPPSGLVLTDRDFGRAYLYDAWATRFLQKMFDRFTVLFVGYSLDDPIMRYLSLGLPSKTRRYVLTHKPEDEKWKHLGIRPISYPAHDGDHSALVAALKAWDSRARMGRLDHRSRMREILDAGPAMTPVDEDYLNRRIRTVDGARDFCMSADSVSWLQWAEGQPSFKSLFNGGQSDPASSLLARWYGEVFVASPGLNGAALQTAQRLGQRFSPELVSSASWGTHRLSSSDEAAARRWKTLLSTSVDGYSSPPDLGLLLPHRPSGTTEPLSVLRTALRPFLTLKRRWYSQNGDGETDPDAEVSWRSEASELVTRLQRAVLNCPPGDRVIGSLLENALNDAYDLLDNYYGDRSFDPLSFSRSAIEPHGQDRHPGPQDALIDALRDFAVRSLPTSPDLPERFWAQGKSLFRRLALHLVQVDIARSADEKLKWILDRDGLYLISERHEIYQVLADAAPGASETMRRELLSQSLLGPTYPEDTQDLEHHREYGVYNLLAWLAQCAPNWEEAAAAFASAQEANPNFGVREHLNFGHWSSSGTWGGRLPVAPEDFVQLAGDDLAAALDDVMGRDYSERNFDEPTWDDALSLFRRVAEIAPSLAIRIWPLIEGREDALGRADQVIRALIGGWEKADLGDDLESVVRLVESKSSAQEFPEPICGFLSEQILLLMEHDDSPALVAMRAVAREVWMIHSPQFETYQDVDPATLALNSWPGELASFWAREVDRRWRRSRDTWIGLNDEETSAILDLLSGPPATLDATRPAFASVTYFLFAADSHFAEQHLLPLFSDPSAARQMWGSYLYNARVNDKMLAAGMVDGILAEWELLDNLGGHGLEQQFFDLVASVVTFAGLTPLDRQRLLDQSVLAAGGAHVSKFASAVVDLLKTEDVDGAEAWDQWLRDHLTSRISGLPRIASSDELSSWADAVPYLGERIPESLEVLDGCQIAFGADFDTPSFAPDVLAHYGHLLVDHFAVRIQNSAPDGWHLPSAVSELVDLVRSALGAAAQPMVDAARERGFSPSD
jgi:tetratricopeptide (TPR) repeat protein